MIIKYNFLETKDYVIFEKAKEFIRDYVGNNCLSIHFVLVETFEDCEYWKNTDGNFELFIGLGKCRGINMVKILSISKSMF